MKLYNIAMAGLLGLAVAGMTSCDDGFEDKLSGLTGAITATNEDGSDITLAPEDTFYSYSFTSLSNWTATVTEGADWLSLREKEGIGGYKTLGLVCEKFVVTVDKGQTADPASTVRNAVVVIKCGASEQTIHVTQTANVVEKVIEIEDIEKYYKPAEFGNMDMYSSASRWSFARMKQSEHFFVFWEAGFGDDPNAESVPAELRVDIDDLLQKAEKFYNTNITRLGMATVGQGKSYLDQYKMEIYLLYQTEWLATGSGYDDVIGALWVNPSTCQPVGSTIGHEIGHSFQYQVYCDQVLNGAPNDFTTGFRYGYDGSNGGNGFWEQCAQWQSYQDYPQQYFGDGWYNVWPLNCHRHFENEWMRYASYWLQCYWTEKHGDKTVASIWQNSRYPYDAIQTYSQLYNGDSWNATAAELYDYAARMATYDVLGPREYSAAHLNDYTTKFYDSGDGYYQVAYAQCPGSTGFNIIPLNPVAGQQISADFVGLEMGSALAAGDPGEYMKSEKVDGTVTTYNKADKAGNEGWRYGFAAYLNDGSRKYSEMFSDANGTATWTVPAGTEQLYMIVMGAPKEYVQSAWDENELTDAQYPYKVKFSGTDLKGNFDIDPTADPKDITLQFTVNCAANSPEYLQGTLDLSANRNLAQAFVLKPSDIVGKIQAVGAQPAEGNIVWACLQSDGSYSYNSTANNGFWCNTQGDNAGWNAGYGYVEFAALTISYGQYPGKNNAGDSFKLTPTLIYTRDGVQYKAAIEITFVFE